MNPTLIAKYLPRQTLALFGAFKDRDGVYHLPAGMVHDLAKGKPEDAPRIMGQSTDNDGPVKPELTRRVHRFLQTLPAESTLTIVPSTQADDVDVADGLDFATYAQDDNENTNSLADFRCPECGEQAGFRIAVCTYARFDDDGGEVDGSLEFDGHYACMCINCNHSATVADFDTMHDE